MKFSCVGLIKVEHPAGTTHILHSYLYSCNGNSWKFVVGQSNGSFNVCNYCVTSESTCFSCRWVCVCVCVRRWHRIYWSRNSGEALHLVSDHTHTPGCYDFLPLLGRVPMASTHPGYWCKMILIHPLSDLLLGFHVTWRIRMSLCSEWSWKNSVCASWRQTVTTVPPIYCLINSEGAPLTLLVYNLARDTPSYWLSQEAEPSGYVQMTIS